MLAGSLREALIARERTADFLVEQPREVYHRGNVREFTAADGLQLPEISFRGRALNRFYKLAVQAIDSRESAIVAAPTAAGKTLLACYYIAQRLLCGERVFYIVPMKALADEIFSTLNGMFPGQVGYFYGSERFRLGASVLVMTYERFELYSLQNALDYYSENNAGQRDALYAPTLGGSAAILAGCVARQHYNLQEPAQKPYSPQKPYSAHQAPALIVVDEFHFLLLSARGAVLERVLIRFSYYYRFLCLSATIPQLEALAAWTGFACLHFDDSFRPHNVKFFRWGSGDLGRSIQEIDARGENCIVFVQSRTEIARLAEIHKLLPKKQDIKVENSLLRHTTYYQTAFHSAGLARADQRAVEAAFRAGQIRLLFSTATLAYGVNLDADNVVLLDSPVLPFSPAELIQITGRTGRKKPGVAYLLGCTEAPTTPRSSLIDDLLKTLQICAFLNAPLLACVRASFYAFCSEICNIEELMATANGVLVEMNVFTAQNELTDFGRSVTKIYQPITSVVKAATLLRSVLPRRYSVPELLDAFLPPLNDEQRSICSQIAPGRSPGFVFTAIRKTGNQLKLDALAQPYEEFCQNAGRILNMLLLVASEARDARWAIGLATEAVFFQNEVCSDMLLDERILGDKKLVQAIYEQDGNIDECIESLPETSKRIVEQFNEKMNSKCQIYLQPVLLQHHQLKIALEEETSRLLVASSERLLLEAWIERGKTTLDLDLNFPADVALSVYVFTPQNILSKHFNLYELKEAKARCEHAAEFGNLEAVGEDIERALYAGRRVAVLGAQNVLNQAKTRWASTVRTLEDARQIANDYRVEVDLIEGKFGLILSLPFANSDDLADWGDWLVFRYKDVPIGLPIESCFDLNFGGYFRQKVEVNVDAFMGLLEKSFLVQRMQHNPSFYGIKLPIDLERDQTVTEDPVSDFLSGIIEQEVQNSEYFEFDGQTIRLRGEALI